MSLTLPLLNTPDFQIMIGERVAFFDQLQLLVTPWLDQTKSK